ncbi:Imm50 family immunity protein [Massilia glaciei]|uniref:Immunity protein 50 n=1 Tax=Massilia glaciei TaxID=1524097 RepID=A0A2U2I6V7_9BURK|nr:hypothetical protein C7C56_001870 [Massilia glaciei]
MNHWTDLLQNPEGINAIFADGKPSLVAVDLHEIVLKTDASCVTLRFDVAQYPLAPPKKWVAQACNRVQIALMLIGVSELAIKGWKTSCRIDFELERVGGGLRLIAGNGPVGLEILADFAHLSSLSAYCDSGLAPDRE